MKFLDSCRLYKADWEAKCRHFNAQSATLLGFGAFVLFLFWAPSTKVAVNVFYLIILPLSLTLGRWLVWPFLKSRTAKISVFFVFYFALSSLWSPTDAPKTFLDALRHAFCMLIFIPVLYFFMKNRPLSTRINHLFWFTVSAGVSTFLSIIFTAIQHKIHQPLWHRPYYFEPALRIAPSSWLYGFGAICALFAIRDCHGWLKKGISSGCLLILLSGVMLTTPRATLLGVVGAAAVLVFTDLWKRKNISLLIAVAIASACITTILCYTSLAPSAPAKTQENQSSPTIPSPFDETGDGLRIPIWTSALDQMPGRWIFGHGLKKHYPWLQTDYLDYALPSPLANLHSIVFWALYHGGVVGLLLLCSLLISAFFAALRAAACSASPFALCWLIYGSSCAVFTGSSFIYRPAPEWLIFWGPVCYVITASLVSNDSLRDEE